MTTSILIMSVDTRQLKRFKSLSACAEFFNVTPACISNKINKKNISVPYRGYFIKCSYDETPWPDEISFSVRQKPVKRSVSLKNIETGIIKNYKSVNLAAKFLGCHRQSIKSQADRRKAKPYKGYLVRYA